MNFRTLGRGALSFALLAAASFTVAAISPECSKVQDEVTRPEILGDPTGGAGQSSSYEACERACRRAADVLIHLEDKRHRDALQDCRKNDNGHHRSNNNQSVAQCIQRENELHARILAEIERRLLACIEACHNQGGGGGGHHDD